MGNGDYDRAIEQLASYLALSDDAILIAEGWTVLPARLQRHIKILIDDYIGGQMPELRRLYDNASIIDQLRFNRLVENIQADKHNKPPSGEPS